MSILSATASWAGTETTAGLRTDGWRVVDKHERQEKRPGLPPYQALVRVVQITTFVLTKDGERRICDMIYDSQRDRITETCRAE